MSTYLLFAVYIISLVKCLIDRAYKLNNTWLGFHYDIKIIAETLKRNLYPQHLIDKLIKSYLNKVHSISEKENNNTNIRYFKLPYIGKFSDLTQTKLNSIISKYCKDV